MNQYFEVAVCNGKRMAVLDSRQDLLHVQLDIVHVIASDVRDSLEQFSSLTILAYDINLFKIFKYFQDSHNIGVIQFS